MLKGRFEVFNGMLKGRFEDIIQKVIKDVVSSQFSHDLLQKLGKKTLTLFNTSFSLGFDFLNSRLGSFNSGINGSLQFVKKVNNIVLDLTRFNLSLDFIENILDMLGNFHDVSNGQ